MECPLRVESAVPGRNSLLTLKSHTEPTTKTDRNNDRTKKLDASSFLSAADISIQNSMENQRVLTDLLKGLTVIYCKLWPEDPTSE